MTPSTDQPLSYSSQAIPPGEVRIDRDADRVQISAGPLDGKGWIAALLPPIGSIILGAAVFALEIRSPSLSGADLFMDLFFVGTGVWTLYLLIRIHGRSRVITVNRETFQVAYIGLPSNDPVPVTEMMRIRARRVWWSPIVWSLVAEGYPKWWRRRLGIPEVEKMSRAVGRELLLLGRRDAVKEAAEAMQAFVPNRPPPPVWRWVPWTVAVGMACFGSLAVWSIHASLRTMSGSIWLSTLSIMAFFALPISAMIAVDKGCLRQPDGRPIHRNNAAEWVMVIMRSPTMWIVRRWKKFRGDTNKTEPSGSAAGASKKRVKRSVMIEGLPPRTMN